MPEDPEDPELQEAKELITRAVAQARGAPRVITEDQAAEVLMGKLAALDGHEGIEFRRHKRQIAITWGDATADVTYDKAHGVQVSVHGVVPQKVVLDRDPKTGRFIGTEQDSRRPAVVVIVEAAKRALGR